MSTAPRARGRPTLRGWDGAGGTGGVGNPMVDHPMVKHNIRPTHIDIRMAVFEDSVLGYARPSWSLSLGLPHSVLKQLD